MMRQNLFLDDFVKTLKSENMTYHVHQIDSNLHKEFLAERRKDPVTKKFIKAGDRIVICAKCKVAFLEDSWKYLGEKHCGQSATLSTIQSSPTNQRFTKKSPPGSGFHITGILTNRRPAGASTSTSAQSARTYTPTNSQTTTTPVVQPNRNLNTVAPILGGVLAVVLSLIFISVIGFALVRFAMSGNNDSTISSSNASANKNTNPTYRNNSTVNRNSSVSANTNKVSNTITSTYSSSSCYLYNDKSAENKVFIRSDCDIYDCDTDASRVIDSLPDNTPINIIKGVSRIKSNVKPYSWIEVEIIDTGQIVWVADSKIKCD